MNEEMKRKLVLTPEWIAFLEYQKRVIKDQDHKIGRNLYLATDIKEKK